MDLLFLTVEEKSKGIKGFLSMLLYNFYSGITDFFLLLLYFLFALNMKIQRRLIRR